MLEVMIIRQSQSDNRKKRTTASSNARTVNDSYRCRRRLFIQHNFHEKFDIEFVVSLFVQTEKPCSNRRFVRQRSRPASLVCLFRVLDVTCNREIVNK